MLTVVLYGLLAIGLMGGLFLLAARFLPAGEQIAPALRDEPVWTLPADRSIKAVDIEELRLPVSLRGYRFAETDELLDRLVAELRRRDDELERLYGLLIAMPVSVEDPTPAQDAGPDGAAVADAGPDGAAVAGAGPDAAVVADAVPDGAVVADAGPDGADDAVEGGPDGADDAVEGGDAAVAEHVAPPDTAAADENGD